MKVSVFGLGYVGCVTAACLADRGHDVTGVDIDDLKVATVDAGGARSSSPTSTTSSAAACRADACAHDASRTAW
jgi:UDP-N-acetyl-D-mannosaminuronate dehydrogenase